MDLAQVLGWIATFLFSIMIIPQMIKTLRSKDTSGVSLFLFLTFLLANMVALIYAVLISQSPLIIKYTIAIVTTLLYIGIYAYFYQRQAK